MGLFNNFVDRAKNKLDDAQNSQERLNHRKFKTPKTPSMPQESTPQVKENKKDKKKKNGEDYEENPFNEDYNGFPDSENYGADEDQSGLFPAQKPESFHFFILENQYQDLERVIRGVKDVWDKEREKWIIKKKDRHCFTDEESEEIVRTAQSHLSSDVKLGILNRQEYPIILQGIYNQLWVMFKSIMDYRFGRFGNQTNQLKAKQQAVNIFNILMMRIKMNYSRAIEGRENSATHDSVKGQESLNQPDRKESGRSYT